MQIDHLLPGWSTFAPSVAAIRANNGAKFITSSSLAERPTGERKGKKLSRASDRFIGRSQIERARRDHPWNRRRSAGLPWK